MKQTLTTIFTLTLTVCAWTQIGATSFASVFDEVPQSEDTVFPNRCNENLPGWGESLGVVSFVTEQEWVISNGEATQIWSAAVTASNCQKASFNGGDWDLHSFNADCRSNPDQSGDLFSWCAVVRFHEKLCPAPWRVPIRQDFVDLDRLLGGTGSWQNNSELSDRFLTVWGGVYSGYCNGTGVLLGQGSWARYWSQSGHSEGRGANFEIGSNSSVYPRTWYRKDSGFSVRCVR